MKILLIAFLTSATVAGLPADTNQFYLIDDFVTHYGDTLPFTPEHIEKAKHSKECRPADQDPEGHWGQVAEGFQLSVRLEKETFTNGEPVVACVILRNVSGKLLRYFTAPLHDPMSKILLTREGRRVPTNNEPRQGTSAPERLKPVFAGSMWSFQSPPGTQRKFFVELNKTFDLGTNGEYVLEAMRTVPALDLKSEKEVASGKATFSISDAAGPVAPPK